MLRTYFRRLIPRLRDYRNTSGATLALFALTGVAGCASNSVPPDVEAPPVADVWDVSDTGSRDAVAEGTVTIDVVPAPQCADESLTIRHASPWPGHGAGFILRAESPSLSLDDLVAAGALAVLAGDHEVQMPLAPAAPAGDFRLILYDEPADGQLSGVLRDALAGFVGAAPPGAAVALYRRCAELEQVAGFTTDTALATGLLASGAFACQTVNRLALDAAVAMAAAEAWAIGGAPYPALTRELLLLTAEQDLDAAVLPLMPMGVDLYIVAPAPVDFPSGAAGEIFPWDDSAPPADVLAAVGQRILGHSADLVAAGACLPGDASGALKIRMPGGAECPVSLPPAPEEESYLPCDAQAIAGGARPYPDRIAFVMTEDERKVFDQYCQDKIKDEFPLSVKVGDAEPVKARAHLRGQTSLDCQRKSFTLDLDGLLPRHLRPFFASDELYLISMCKDDRYYQQIAANLLAAGLDLFPLQLGLVELLVDGETWGVYLLLEKPREGLFEVNSRIQSILRRRFDPEDVSPDVEYPPDTSADDLAILPYWNLVDGLGDLAGQSLLDMALTLFDLDGFLRLMAFHSLMGNGDWVDEIYFYSTESVRNGQLGKWFRFMAWDMDDLYCSCHHSGKHAMSDPYGMLFCAEGNLEKRIMADPVIYARFVDILETLILDEITADRVDAALDQTAALLLPFFDRPEICAAMVELLKSNPDAVSPDVAKADILGEMDDLRADYAARRTLLLDRIAAYRTAVGER